MLEPEASNFIKKETLAQVFSCGFCEISKYTFFTGHLPANASDHSNNKAQPEFIKAKNSRVKVIFMFLFL